MNDCLPSPERASWRASAALLFLSTTAAVGLVHADDVGHTVRLEGGFAAAVTDPQADTYDIGGGGAGSYELLPVPWFGIELRFSAFGLPVDSDNRGLHEFGTYLAPGLALRLHPFATLGIGDLWLSGAGAIAFTGDVIRPAVEVGVGYELPAAWWLRIGPYARYHHVFQTEPGADAGFLAFGVSIAFGGEPPPAEDRDRDGLMDPDDRCPNEPEDVDNFEDADGCPDPDDDRDGVLDGCDRCPRVSEDSDGFEDLDGCPDADNDQDGVPDTADRCPDVAEDVDTFEDADGCPDPDNDQDGVLDASDRCPNEAETRNGFEDVDGCPDVVPPPPRTETEQQLEQLGERIQFAQDGTRVLPASRAALRAVIALLRAHPELTRVVVQAHASSEGSAEHNMTLSRQRAQTVVDALIAGGIARGRVSARSFGEGRPDVAGTTEDELAANRRVMFIVESTVEVPAAR